NVWLDRCENRLNEPANAAIALKLGSAKRNSAQRSEIPADRAADRQFLAKNGSIELKIGIENRNSLQRSEIRRDRTRRGSSMNRQVAPKNGTDFILSSASQLSHGVPTCATRNRDVTAPHDFHYSNKWKQAMAQCRHRPGSPGLSS